MKKIQLTEQQEYDLALIMEETGMSRKSAIRKLQRRAKLQEKAAKATKAQPVQRAKSDAPAVNLPAKNASLVAKGTAYSVLAGRPSKQAVIDAFGKAGYALSWVTRAQRLGIAPEELCERFKDNAAQVKKDWAALATKSASAGAA